MHDFVPCLQIRSPAADGPSESLLLTPALIMPFARPTSRSHAPGQIVLEDYRSMRRSVINSIVEGAPPGGNERK